MGFTENLSSILNEALEQENPERQAMLHGVIHSILLDGKSEELEETLKAKFPEYYLDILEEEEI